MDTFGVIASVIFVIATAVATQIGESIRQWLIENVVNPFGQFLIEKLVQPVGQWLTSYMVEPIGQWLGYSFHYSSNIDNMKEQAEKLRDVRERVKHSVDAGIGNCGENKADVNRWLENVDVIMGKFRKVLEDEAKAKIKCSYGICLNLKLRHELSKNAKKIEKDIDEALKNGEFDKVSYMDSMNSRMLIQKGLMGALRDVNINMIGVWGMPGAGKTTLVREVVWQAKEEKLIDEYAMAAVMQSPDLRRIQGEIADMLDLKFDVETVPGRAIRLRERLKRNKKVLVILDDIWNKLDLEAIGIPCNECKILLTSRDRDVLSCEMNTQKNFELDILSPDEAWSLFEKMAGDSLKDTNLRSVAMQVVEECAGLPLALVTVATALKNKDLFEWEDALLQLRRPSPVHLTGMQAAIYSKIELSYKHLGSPVVKSFFLLCGQMTSTIIYRDLLKYCFGLCLFPGICTLEEARNKVYTLVRNLKDSCLLLEDPHTREYVRMHDLVRDVAILIASDENKFTMRNDDPVKWPDEDALKMCTSISVLARDIHELPNMLVCPKLRYLYVYGRDRDFKISETFFRGMRELKVLDLTKMRLSSLPSSINLLTNLQTLCLDQCVLKDIAVIGELKNLEILSLLSSEFTQLPQEIGLLTRLRLLDLSECTKLEVIPPNVLSNLKQLEELYVFDSFTQWELEGVNNERASLAELKHLSLLTTLEVNIPNANMWPKNLLFKNLKRYQIFIGDVRDQFDKSESSRALNLKLNSSFELEQGIKMLLSGVEDLCLDELKGVKSIISELDSKGFQQLKHLHVQNNSGMKYIIYSKGLSTADVVFPVLETFSLKNMINLEEICHGQIPLTSFCNLSTVIVEHCVKLKFIFSSSIAKSLSQLQTLEIRECSIIGAIVEKEEGRTEDRDMILFPQLRCLVLHFLPKLMGFLSTQNSDIIDAGEVIPESELNFRRPILHEQVVFPNLETLELSYIHSEEILLHNQHRASSSFKLTDPRFQNLRDLTVKGSCNLKYLLSSSTATFMVQLKYLDIEDCKVMEEVLLTEDLGEEEIIPKVLFPQLEHLILKDLPVLKRFCIGSNLRFPSLKGLRIEQCPKLESFIFKPVSSGITVSKEVKEGNSEEISYTAMQPLFNEKVVFPNLETLKLSSIHSEEILLHNQHRASPSFKLTDPRFQNLCNLKVKGSGNLKYLLSSSTATFMIQLKYLVIEDCKVMEEVLLTEDLGEEEIIPKVLFPQLELLDLKDLPVLKRFCVRSNIKLPSLKVMVIEKCPKLESFIFKPATSGMTLSKELKEVNSEAISQTAMQPFFNEEVAFSKLEDMRISDKDNLKMLWHNYQLAPDSFCKLKKLGVARCKNLMNIFPPNMSRRLQNLEELEIRDCNSVEEVFEIRGVNVDEICDSVSIKLRVLRLFNLPKLKHVWSSDLQAILTFPNLQTIEVSNCKSLKSLFPVSVAKSLEQLKWLTIEDCGLEEIVAMEEGSETVTKFVFPRITSLRLKSLLELKCFYPGKHTSEWLSLNRLNIIKCDKVKIFASNELSFSDTDGLGHHVPVQQPLFLMQKIAFANLEDIYITNMDNLKILWHNHQLVPDSFCKLKKLSVSGCKSLISIFPPNMLRRLQNLEELDIWGCDSVEEVFDIRGVNVDEICDMVSTQLRVLRLFNLPKLEHVWSSDPQTSLTFQNLCEVEVSNCKSLKSFFPILGAKSHEQLESLTIGECGLEEIVAMEGVETTIKFLFPHITSLYLQSLPELKCFYPGKHILEWPSLKRLRIYNCDKVKIIASNDLSFQERDELLHHVQVQQPLFPIEKDTLSNFEELKLDWDDTINQTYDRLKAQFFCKLKVLGLYSKDRSTAFPWAFVQGLHNLKELDISNFFLEEICPCGIVDNEGQYAEMFKRLTTLHLSKMPKLMHLWKENSQQGRGIQNLESLHVSECGRLKNLVPSSMCFRNLSTLSVSDCHGLISLATSSTVKSLVQLKSLRIYGCKRMREIVTNEGEGEAGDEICFNQLNFLWLYDLPTLGSFFHLGNRTMKFPSLKFLIVAGCPELKIFNGVLSMPKLHHVGLDGNYWWAYQTDPFPVEDVNTFIKRCWEENNDPYLRQLFTQKINASTSEAGEENDVDDLEDDPM